MIVGLRVVVVSQVWVTQVFRVSADSLAWQAKSFLQAFHQSRINQSAKLVEDEQWGQVDVSHFVTAGRQPYFGCGSTRPTRVYPQNRDRSRHTDVTTPYTCIIAASVTYITSFRLKQPTIFAPTVVPARELADKWSLFPAN